MHFWQFLQSVLTDRIWPALISQVGALYTNVVKRLELPRLLPETIWSAVKLNVLFGGGGEACFWIEA